MVIANLKQKAVSSDPFSSDRGGRKGADFPSMYCSDRSKAYSISDVRAESDVKLCHVDLGRAKDVRISGVNERNGLSMIR